MKNFDYVVAGRIEDAFVSDGTTTMPIAGGTELLNWFRLGISAPDRIIDLGRIDKSTQSGGTATGSRSVRSQR